MGERRAKRTQKDAGSRKINDPGIIKRDRITREELEGRTDSREGSSVPAVGHEAYSRFHALGKHRLLDMFHLNGLIFSGRTKSCIQS